MTFNPSREKAVLYYFQALSAQKRLGVEVEFDKIAALLDNGNGFFIFLIVDTSLLISFSSCNVC